MTNNYIKNYGCRKKKYGKKSLIKYDLKKVSKKDFRSYQNDTIPYLRLIKYKGIYDMEN